MRQKTCFFIGHRDAPESIIPILSAEVERHIVEYGISTFVVGRYGRFDSLAARTVIAAKAKHPNVMLALLLPYHPAERPVDIPTGFDETIYPSGLEKVPRRYAIVEANKAMIRQSDYLIAYVTHPASNASKFLSYAKRRELDSRIITTNIGGVINLGLII